MLITAVQKSTSVIHIYISSFLKIYFQLKDNCFTILSWFVPYTNYIYIYMCILFHIPFHHKPYSINNKPYSIIVYHRVLNTFLFKYLFVYLGVLGLSGKIPWRRKGQPAPVFLPGESQGLKRPSGHWVLAVACRILLHLSF